MFSSWLKAHRPAVFFSILVGFAVFPGVSQALDLGMPIACNYGRDCFISNYFDHDDSTEGAIKDHTCGAMTEDGHKSTDFILRNIVQMKDGVNVVAGDDGVVKYVRNDMNDVSVELSGVGSVRGRECGNGLVIEHKRGYETQYCHLKQDSIVVKPHDKVEKGQNIGQVGLSGLTSFPYLEFIVRLNGKAVDPFTGEDPVTGKAEVACDSLDIYPLWDKQTEKTMSYIHTALLSSGFSSTVPNAQGARENKYNSPNIYSNSKLVAFWVDILGVMQGDQLKISIISPKGEEIRNDTRDFNADKRHLFQFIGTKLGDNQQSWEKGEYVGRVELFRKTTADQTETVIDSRNTIEVIDMPAKKENK